MRNAEYVTTDSVRFSIPCRVELITRITLIGTNQNLYVLNVYYISLNVIK